MNRVAWSFNAAPSRRTEVGVRNYLSYPRHEIQPLPDGQNEPWRLHSVQHSVPTLDPSARKLTGNPTLQACTGLIQDLPNKPNVSERIDDRSPRKVVIPTDSAVGRFLYKIQAQPICFKASSAFHTLLMLTILSPSKCMM
jgi:hypothetical protein